MNHFDVLKQVIAEEDGAMVKTIGDAVMAVFRQPASALRAMLHAQQRLAAPTEGMAPLQLKAGLHMGPCIAVTLNDRLDYFGSTVNMAAPFGRAIDGRRCNRLKRDLQRSGCPGVPERSDPRAHGHHL